tara:strand:- start:695 stop:1615 length:921 start_codon:yes stop_codon:yes gene_type:complete
MKLYGILGLNHTATEKEIKKSYYKLAKQYHPDKNNGKKMDEFQQINYAYTILINPKTREEYLKLNNQQEDDFIKFLMKITMDNITSDDLSNLNIKIKELVDITINNLNLSDFLKNLDFIQLFDIFNNKKIKSSDIITETEEDDETNILYYYNLPPKYIDYNINNIELDFTINISNILHKDTKKIKIIRSINKKEIKENFTFELKTPFIIFPNKGDNNTGHLIIKLNLKENIDWYQDMIIINYPITIHQFLYGLDVNVNIFENDFSYNKWIPNRDGVIIFIKNYNISIRFIIDYTHNREKEKILLNF